MPSSSARKSSSSSPLSRAPCAPWRFFGRAGEGRGDRMGLLLVGESGIGWMVGLAVGGKGRLRVP